MRDPAVWILGACLIAAIVADVVIVTLKGTTVLAGSGLGGLIVVLASALTWRVRSNGKNGS